MMRRIILSLCMLGVVVDSSHAMMAAPNVAAPAGITKANLIAAGKLVLVLALAAAAGYAVYERESIASWYAGDMKEACLTNEQAALEAFDKLTECRAQLDETWAGKFNTEVVAVCRAGRNGCDADVKPVVDCNFLLGVNAPAAEKLATCMNSLHNRCDFYTGVAADVAALESVGIIADITNGGAAALPDATAEALSEATTEAPVVEVLPAAEGLVQE